MAYRTFNIRLYEEAKKPVYLRQVYFHTDPNCDDEDCQNDRYHVDESGDVLCIMELIRCWIDEVAEEDRETTEKAL